MSSAELTRTVETLHSPGAVVELRTLKDGATFSGYFDDHQKLVEAAAKYDERGHDVYITLNKLPDEIAFRRYNRTEQIKGRDQTTSDRDVERRRYLFIDADCERVSGISSTDEEKRKSRDKVLEIREFLRAQSWPEPIVCDSGNGYHLLYPVDLPNDQTSLELIAGVLDALDFKFSDDAVKVDTTTKNAARITKFYGTVAKKGDDLPQRPHRPSKILKVPATLALVSREQLEEVAAMKPEEPRRSYVHSGGREYEEFDLEGWIARHNIPVKREGPWASGGYKWILEECLNGHTDNSGYILRMPSGAIVARCHHNSCDYEWRDFRKHYEPGAYERRERNGGWSWAESSDSSDSFSKERYSVKTPPFPTDALPPGCARYVKEAAASLRCAPELVGVPVLAALSGVMGHTAVIRIKAGWTVSGSMYAAVVDSPGSRKSPAADLAYKPLEKLQAMLRKAHKQELETFNRAMREHAVKKKRAAKEDQPEPDPPIRPKMRRCIVDDITVEALATRLEQNPRGFLSAHDELTGFIKGLDQYKSGGKGNARQYYLKMWSNNAIYVDRKGSDEPVVVPNPYVTLQGAIQPSVLGEIRAGRDDGFLDRFIFAYPEPHGGGYSDDTISAQAELTYYNVIGELWNRQPAGVEDDEVRPRVVRMDPEAKELFIEAANNLATEMHAVGFPEVLRGPWSKLDTQLARLALILAVTRTVEEDAASERVTRSDMRNALRLLDYFKATTRKVYGQLFEANPDDVLAADLMNLLRQSQYVFSGTISQLREALESTALPDTPEALGKAVRRIVSKSPELSLESRSTGKERIITITLAKPSEPSADDSEEDAHRERVRQSW
jgi:Protein of unknown function (DUF3987)